MYMNAEVAIAPNKAFVISNDGLVRFEGKEYVFIQESKNRFALQEVSTQNNENGYTQVAFPDNLAVETKTFVTTGAYALLMAMKNTEEAK